MTDLTPEDIPEEKFEDTDAVFTCPNDGEISRDDVIFLCNNCEQADVVYKDGIYLCPSCLNPGENFQCMKCDSKQVKMTLPKKSKSDH